MAIIRCDKGHYYDNTKFSQCPHCGVLPIMEQEQAQKEEVKPKRFSFFSRQESAQAAQNSQTPMYGGSDHTVAMSPVTGVYDDSDHTVAMPAAGGGSYDDDHTIALTPSRGSVSGRDDNDDRTIAIPAPPKAQGRYDDDDRTIAIPAPPKAPGRADDDDRTIAIPKPSRVSGQDDDDDHTIAISTGSRTVPPEPPVRKEDSAVSQQGAPAGQVNTARGEERPAEIHPRDYVVGWLVCVDGLEKGRDYRLYRGFNRLGGSNAMNIIVEGDAQLRMSVAAVVVYDDKSNSFVAAQQPGGRALLNGKELHKAEKLVSGDILEAGESKFQFIPFCCEGRTWESHE